MSTTGFIDLPTEIRRQIWRTSLQRRTIAVAHEHPENTNTSLSLSNRTTGNIVATTRFFAVRPPHLPPTVRASREARDETLRFYPWVAFSIGGNAPQPPERFRFNCELDQLLLVGCCGGSNGRPIENFDEEAEGVAAFKLVHTVCSNLREPPAQGFDWFQFVRHLAVDTRLFLAIRRSLLYHTSPEANSALRTFIKAVQSSPTLQSCTFYERLRVPFVARLTIAPDRGGRRRAASEPIMQSFRLVKCQHSLRRVVDGETRDWTLRHVGAVLSKEGMCSEGEWALFRVVNEPDVLENTSIAGQRYESLRHCLNGLLQVMTGSSDKLLALGFGVCMPDYGLS